MLLQTAVADMDLHSTFQSILLSKFACCVTAFLTIRCGQPKGEESCCAGDCFKAVPGWLLSCVMNGNDANPWIVPVREGSYFLYKA